MNKNTWILIVLIISKFVIQYFLIGPGYELHRDEFLHLDQGYHPAWGYLSVPPVTSWISFIIMMLGGGVFWVKFFPALFGAITIWIVWKIIQELNGNTFALLMGGLAVMFSVIFRINTLFQPNSLDILMWTLFYFTLIKYIKSENPKWLYCASIVFGFGFLNKYNIVFLVIGLFIPFIFSKYRKLFTNKHLYLSLLCALIIMLPNIIWQYKHNFPVILHMQELADTQLANVDRMDFLKEQVLFFIGSIFVIIAGFVGMFTFQPFRKYQILFWTFLITLFLFIYFKAKGYYAIGLYPVFIAFGSVYLEHLTSVSWKRYIRPVALLCPVLLFLPIINLVFPILSPFEISKRADSFKDMGLLRWEDGEDHSLPQDFADMLGWNELAHKTDSAYEFIKTKGQTFILCDNYGQAGAINYYSKNKEIRAVSFNSDYVSWFDLGSKIENMIMIKEDMNIQEDMPYMQTLFSTITTFDKINNPFARESGTTIYLLTDPKVDINKYLQSELSQKID